MNPDAWASLSDSTKQAVVRQLNVGKQ